MDVETKEIDGCYLAFNQPTAMELERSHDGSFKEYLHRVAHTLNPDSIQASLDHLSVSDKYHQNQPLFFPGVTLVSPLGSEDQSAALLYTRLEQDLDSLKTEFSREIVPIQASTFHITGADLIAGTAYQEALKIHQYDAEGYFREIQSALIQESQVIPDASLNTLASTTSLNYRWDLAGFTLFGSAVVCLLQPKLEEAYLHLIGLRSRIYNHPYLHSLGIRPPRPFMAHITLGYYQSELFHPSTLTRLAQWCIERNQALATSIHSYEAEASCVLNQMQLRSFEDMTDYVWTAQKVSCFLTP